PILQSIQQSAFLKHNLVFLIGSVGVGVLNYAYYPLLSRLLPPAAFGEVQVLVSIFLQLTIFLNVVSMVTVHVVTNYHDATKANRVVFELERWATWAACGLLILTLLCAPLLRDLLHFDSMLPFVGLGLALVVSVPLALRGGYARGKHKFAEASWAAVIGSAAKILLSAALVVTGLGTVGAILGIIAAQLAALAYIAYKVGNMGFARPEHLNYWSKLEPHVIVPELTYSAAVFVGSLSIALLMSIDVIAAKYFFDAHTAGLYAAIATVARIIFFLTVPVSQVLLTKISLQKTHAQNRAMFLKSLALTVGLGGIVAAVCAIAPQAVVTILMGKGYTDEAASLPLLAFALLIVSVANLAMTYFLSLRRHGVVFVGIMGFVVTLMLLLVRHNDVQAIADSMFWGSIWTLILFGLYTISTTKREAHHDSAATHISHRSGI
ncbi:MAG TPA: oligosaccharide flippase family protein, partial [Magnetospirillaceae bacterium]|nr:oligosaccharide flippase family protein [Magnetospirillaceae bacterium]